MRKGKLLTASSSECEYVCARLGDGEATSTDRTQVSVSGNILKGDGNSKHIYIVVQGSGKARGKEGGRYPQWDTSGIEYKRVHKERITRKTQWYSSHHVSRFIQAALFSFVCLTELHYNQHYFAGGAFVDIRV